MYAIVREEDGKHYTSTVFGYYNFPESKWDYEHMYYVVLNREKTALVIQKKWRMGNYGIASTVLPANSNQDDWILDDENAQSMAFLPTDKLYNMVETNTVPADILQKCIDIDRAYTYNPYPEIHTAKDVEDFEWASGGLHDAYITEIKQADDSVYVLFKGTWGCDIEVWFSGDVSYDVSAREHEKYNEEWVESTVIIKDGFVYLIDEYPATAENAREGRCWFKARQMKYHIIPE